MGESFSPVRAPGDEKVYFGSVEVPSLRGGEVLGDGTPMEEGSRPVILDLRDAIEQCRKGQIPDMKTEVALLRLADQVGYLPALDLFVDELPDAYAKNFRPPGIERP